MQLRDQFEADGDWLFRHRSLVPLLLVPVCIVALSGVEFARSHAALRMIDIAACGLAGLGLLVRACVVGFVAPGTSGRNIRRQRADVLNTTGVYSIVRHPLYVGNFLVVLGWTLACGNLWLLLTVVLLYILYYERIAIREEAFLLSRFGEAFLIWAASTPACLPRRWQWTSPGRKYRWSRLARREYQTVCVVVVGFVTVHLLRALLVPADAASARLWIAVGLADAAIFAILWLAFHLRRPSKAVAGVTAAES
ncbi:MAG: isoprenylcysteine carboxylmethyltransferase family protein [Planctomycetaceae bacterium]